MSETQALVGTTSSKFDQAAETCNINTDTCRACLVQNDRNEMIFLFENSDLSKTFSKCTSLEVTSYFLYK